MVHTQDLHTGIRNVGMYRMQVFDGQTTAMHWHIHKTGAKHYQQYKEAGRRMPVVVTLGGNPIYTYCATAPLPDGVDEYLLAGFLQGKPVRLMPCLTQPLCVPEDVDFVIEGYIDPQEELVMEGPFGDHTGFYSLPDLYPLFHITAITHKQGAIYPATLVGIPPQEDAYITMATESFFLPLIRFGILPEIEDMYMPCEGVTHNIAIVSIKKQYEGQAQKTANALWGAGQMMFNKILAVVDDAVNIRDTESLLKSATDRFNPNTDIYYGQGALDVLDHAAQKCGYGGKMCIDLTKKDDTLGSTDNKMPLFAFIHKGNKHPQARIVAEFDEMVDIGNLRICIWLLGSNIDPVRDCKTVDGQLFIDATSKPHKTLREWPDIVRSPKETIESINRKWNALGIGEFVPSPSEL
jgi:4-hydroxy-3-polyprenylbenzoate decarboxylase